MLKKSIVLLVVLSVLTAGLIFAQSKGFKITGYKGGYAKLFVSPHKGSGNGKELYYALVVGGIVGEGFIRTDGTVNWDNIPPSGSYWLYIMIINKKNEAILTRSSSQVSINAGNGQVAYKSFGKAK